MIGVRAIVLAVCISATAALSPVPLAEARTHFFASLDDVPLPPGFTERTADATAFEGQPGRILLAAADGPGPAASAQSWTVTALKGLGWSVSEADPARTVLIRGREVLTVEAAPDPSGVVTLRVRLVVRPAPSGED